MQDARGFNASLEGIDTMKAPAWKNITTTWTSDCKAPSCDATKPIRFSARQSLFLRINHIRGSRPWYWWSFRPWRRDCFYFLKALCSICLRNWEEEELCVVMREQVRQLLYESVRRFNKRVQAVMEEHFWEEPDERPSLEEA